MSNSPETPFTATNLVELRRLQADSSETLTRLRREMLLAIESWAMFESSNGYPSSGRRKQLLANINKHHESWGLINIRLLAMRDTILTLYRIIDYYDPCKTRERQTLQRVKYYLQNPDAKEFLIQEASSWLSERSVSEINKNVVRRIYPLVMARMGHGVDARTRNILSVRESISHLRNSALAHALVVKKENFPNVYNIRDGLVLTASLIQKCSLIIAGVNWDPKEHWRTSLRNSQQFWNRYQAGFDA